MENYAPDWYVNAQGIEESAAIALISPTYGASLLSGFDDNGGFRHDPLWAPVQMFDPYQSGVDGLDWAGNEPAVIVRVGNSGPAYNGGCGVGMSRLLYQRPPSSDNNSY